VRDESRGEERREDGKGTGGASWDGGGHCTTVPYLIMAFTVSDSHEVVGATL
jgi:hypothetical protein